MLGVTADVLLRHPWKVIAGYTVLAVASVAAAVMLLEFQTNQNALVSNDLEYNRRFLKFREEFGDLEYLYVVIEVRDLRRAKAIAEAVAEEMQALPEHVSGVFHKVETDPRSALIYVPRALLERLSSLLSENEEAVREFLSIDGLPSFCELVVDRLDARAARENEELAELGLAGLGGFLTELERAVEGRPVKLPDLDSFCSNRARQPADPLTRLGEREGIDASELINRVCSEGYLYTGDLILVRILPFKDFTKLEVIREPKRAILAALDRVRARFPDRVERIGLTGRPVLQADEMETTNRDMVRASVLAVLGVLALFMVFFREIRRPTLAALTLVVGVCITFGVVTVTVGHLNLLTMVFAVMLVAMGMEFGIHVIARYQEELLATGSVDGAIRNALLTAGKGNVTGATTTAAAFYTTLFIDFRGLAELGFIAGTGLLLCMIAMNTLLPALIAVTERRRSHSVIRPPVRLGFLGVLASRPAWTLPAFVISVLVGLPFLRGVRFDANLLELQAVGLPSVQYEKLILQSPGIKTWFAAYVVESIDDVRRLTEELTDERYENVIGKVESLLDYVPDDQMTKIELVRRLASRLGAGIDGDGAPFAELTRRLDTLDLDRLRDALERLLSRLESYLSGTLRVDGKGARTLEDLTDRLDRLIEKIDDSQELARERLIAFQVAWGRQLESAHRALTPLLDPVPVSVEDLDPIIKQRVISKSGKYLVLAYPKKDIWKGENMAEFIHAIREVDEEVTGVPVQVYESTRLMRRGFVIAALYSLVAVFLLILLDFRSILFTVLAMVPVLLALCWVAEVMPVLGISFNLANFFSIPILIGEGINGGVHIIHRFREDRSARVATRSTGTAVTLSYLNTLVGFGMLLLAHHRGLASLGMMMVLGSAASLVSSTLVLPAILKLVEGRRWHADRE